MLPTGYGGIQGLRPLQELRLRRDAQPLHRRGRQARLKDFPGRVLDIVQKHPVLLALSDFKHPPSGLSPPVRPVPLNGVRSEPALVVLPGPEGP